MSDLLGYLLKLDEPDERQRAEERLRTDPTAAADLRTLQRALAPLELDREAPSPPADLVARTIGRIAEHACATSARGEPTDPVGPHLSSARWRSVIAALDRAEAPARWRRADLLVVASILLVGFGMLLAATPHLRQRHNLLACQNHLRQLHLALETYADTHQGRFPQMTDDAPHNMAASFVSLLQEAGALTANDCPRCPAAGDGPFSSYAYTLGYRDEAGKLTGLGWDVPERNRDLLPVVADRPALGRRSPNPDHVSGQNVLYAGGNVRFCTTSGVGVGGDDIYRNQLGRVGAGVSLFDSALGVSGDRP